MNPKAQITGQIFIYIMVIVVVGLIFLLGYKYIGTILGAKCDTEEAAFFANMQKFADNYDGYNEVATEEVKTPCSYSKVCFVDIQAIKDKATINQAPLPIRLSVEEGVEQNIFLLDDDKQKSGYSEKIKVKNSFICINRTGAYFNIRFRGTSEQTFVEPFYK